MSNRRAAVESVFYEAMYRTLIEEPGLPSGRPGEVLTLIRFFLQLPEMQNSLNAVLGRDGISVEFKGAFCHKSGSAGPVVDFDIPTAGNGCELCDLLVLVTYGEGDGALTMGNACFLQAKVERLDLDGGRSTTRQRQLYEGAPTFRFRDAGKYSSAGFSDGANGHRTMPGPSSSGFCYWTFRDGPSPNSGWGLNSGCVIIPSQLGTVASDVPFGRAMFDLIVGELGKEVEPPPSNDTGWNRIVHDVLISAMSESLSCSAGVVGVSAIPRIRHAGRGLLKQVLQSKLALVANPFTGLAAAFGTEPMKSLATKFADQRREIDADTWGKIMRDDGDGPPEEGDTEGPGDGPGGGSFIHINLSKKDTAKAAPEPERSLKL